MPARPPLLSIVVPVHNRGDLARACLAALARWTTPLEVIVVDDGSTDPEVETLRRENPTLSWLRNPSALGFSGAVNRGLAAATGDVLLLLNSDAEVTEGGDHALLSGLTLSDGRGRRAGAVAARLIYPNGRPQWSGGRFPTLPWLFALASGLGRGSRLRLRRTAPSGFRGGPVDWAPGAAMAIARDAYETVGGFDEDYAHYAQDLDFCQRLALAGRSVHVLADWIVVHHLGGSVDEVARAAGPADSHDSDRPAGSGYDGQRLDLLWRDLLRWGERHRGPRWAARARRTLLLGGRLRRFRLRSRAGSPEELAVTAALAAISAR